MNKKILQIAWYGIENNRVLIGIILLISCFLMPAFTVISLVSNSSSYVDENSAREVIKIYGTLLAYFEGFALPLGLFGYVHKRRDCDFYNSMPVRRSQYFWGYVLTGIAVFLVSFCFTFAVHFVILGFKNIFTCFLQPIAMFLVIYCSMILAVCFSGSVMSSLVTFAVRNAVFISLLLLPIVIAGVDMNAYLGAFEERICIFTPILTVAAWSNEEYLVMLLQLAVAAVELIAAFLLHKFRKSESTTAIAFPRSRWPFQYFVMLIIIFLADSLLSSMFFYDGYEDMELNKNLYLFLLITAIVILLSFVVLNIILERNGKAAFFKIRHFFIFTVCYGLALFAIINYIAPNIPYEILPFKPTHAVIIVDELTVTKQEEDPSADDYDDFLYDEYYYNDDYGYETAAEAHGTHYTVNASYAGREAYCITDPKTLKKLTDLVQAGKNKEGTFTSSGWRYGFPSVTSEEELYSVKSFTVYLLKGDVPYVVEGMSVNNFDSLSSSNTPYCEIRNCFTKDESILEQFKETRVDPRYFNGSYSRYGYTVFIADDSAGGGTGDVYGDTALAPAITAASGE